MNVLMVCTGNICRSPMAEAMLNHELGRRDRGDIEVRSAGTWAWFGNPATPEALEVLHSRGIDFEQHRSRPVDPDELARADLVVAMTSVHVRELKQISDEIAPKMVLMKELVELEVAVPESPEIAARLKALLAGTRPAPRRSLDLDDPMGLPVHAYERAAGEIAAGVDRLMALLCGGEAS